MGTLAQRLEQGAHNALVVGSIPSCPNKLRLQKFPTWYNNAMRHPTQKEPIYGNCIILAPDGQMLCRCDIKKAKWYLSRDLASLEIENPLTVKLKFEPKGRGAADDPYYLAEKANRCVVCGREDGLTKHHAVPYFFRKMFPPIIKNHSSHDVVPVCHECHAAYEVESQKLRMQIAEEMGYTPQPKYKKSRNDMIAPKLAFALKHHGNKMPEVRKNELIAKLTAVLGHNPTEDEIHSLCRTTTKKYSHPEVIGWIAGVTEAVINMTEPELHAFCKRWRQHFISVMKPKYMLQHWDVNHMRKEWTDPVAREKWESNFKKGHNEASEIN